MPRAARAGLPPRIHVGERLRRTAALRLAPTPSRHLQVLRLQPGDALTLFDGGGGEWSARVVAMARDHVTVAIDGHRDVERELACRVTVAIGMPANDRMDTFIEKATELGVDAIQPILSARSVLRLEGERGVRRIAHWRAIAVAACEQCGRNRVPHVHDIRALDDWLSSPGGDAGAARWLLSPCAAAVPTLQDARAAPSALLVLSGPEGGFTADEEASAQAAGFRACSLGARVLRADTAPLVVLAGCAWLEGASQS